MQTKPISCFLSIDKMPLLIDAWLFAADPHRTVAPVLAHGMGTAAWAGIVAAAVAVLVALTALARFVFQAPLLARNERIDADNKRLDGERDRAESERAREHELRMEVDLRYETLRRDFSNLKLEKAGVVLKHEIDAALLDAMDVIRVHEASILVPAPAPYASHFVFLSIFGPAAAKLKRTKLPINKGIVGRVFASGVANRLSNAPADPDFFEGIDRKGDHETRALLTLPIRGDGHSLGVAQFLNKPTGFSDEDEAAADQMVSAILPKVAAFVNVPENFQALDIAWRTDRKEATIAFCDLTSSTSLLSEMSVPSAIDCINEYLELQCDIAMDSGATVDKYTGDGVMLRFNVPRPIKSQDHTTTAVEAAIRMREAHRRLRARWLIDGLPVESTYCRIALARGEVYEATIGHPQFQQITVIGAPVNAAANMCDSAPRDRDVIVINEQVRARLDGSFSIRPVDGSVMSRPMYELL